MRKYLFELAQARTQDVCISQSDILGLVMCENCDYVNEDVPDRIGVTDANTCSNCGQQLHPGFVFYFPEHDRYEFISISSSLAELIAWEKER